MSTLDCWALLDTLDCWALFLILLFTFCNDNLILLKILAQCLIQDKCLQIFVCLYDFLFRFGTAFI